MKPNTCMYNAIVCGWNQTPLCIMQLFVVETKHFEWFEIKSLSSNYDWNIDWNRIVIESLSSCRNVAKSNTELENNWEIFGILSTTGHSSCPGWELTRVRVFLSTSILGYELSCPGYVLSCVRVILVRVVLGTSCPQSLTKCRTMVFRRSLHVEHDQISSTGTVASYEINIIDSSSISEASAEGSGACMC